MRGDHAPRLVDAHVVELPTATPSTSLDDWAKHQPGTGYICRVDERWTCVYVTPTIERLLGVGASAWLEDPMRWLEHTHPEDRDRLLIERMTATTEGRRFSVEYRMVRPDGGERWVRDEAELEVREGELAFVHGLLTDVTYQHRSLAVRNELYEGTRREVARLRQEIRERKAFVRLLAHDLRVPLAVVQGAVQTIERLEDSLEPVRQRELLTRASAAALRCRDLVHELLEIDRWTAASSIDPTPIALSELVDRAVAEAGIGTRRVDLDVAEGEVEVDPVVVTRALANLVVNAARHTPEDGTIRVHADRHHDAVVVFSVEDEGTGIPDELKERIFEPYMSLEVEAEGAGPVESLGLGLALVGALAELHGGRVWVEDLPEVGSVFHLLVAGR
jgi:phosphoserine phosphatase RsbU/P